jgi:hypothetical protein
MRSIIMSSMICMAHMLILRTEMLPEPFTPGYFCRR